MNDITRLEAFWRELDQKTRARNRRTWRRRFLWPALRIAGAALAIFILGVLAGASLAPLWS